MLTALHDIWVQRWQAKLLTLVAVTALISGLTLTSAQAATSVDLSVTKTDDATEVVAGTSTTYTITLTNNSETETVPAGVVLSDTIPAGTDGSTTSGDCAIDSPTMTCTTGADLAAGAGVDYTLTLDVHSDFTPGTGALSNTVSITNPGPDNTDPNNTNDQATDTDDVTAEADLAVAVDASPSGAPPAPHAVAGVTVEDYHVTVTNLGPSTATGGYVASAQLPDGTLFDPSNPACSELEGTITCDRTGIDPIAANGTDDFHVLLDLQPSIGDAGPTDATTITFTIDLGSFGTPQPSESTGNDEASADVVVYSESDLTIVKSVTTPAGAPTDTIYANTDPTNSKVVFHISVTNDGVSDAHNVTIHDTLDPDLLTGAVCSGGPECPVTYAGTITIGTLAPGAANSKSFDIEAHANPSLGHASHTTPADRAPGPYTNQNTATVTSPTPAHTSDSRSSGPFLTMIDTVPGSPRIQITTTGQTSAGVEWFAPTSTGGQSIDNYRVDFCVSDGSTCTGATTSQTISRVPNASIGGTPAFSYIFFGLTTASTYEFKVFATNVVGDSDPATVFLTPSVSAANNIIPQTGSASVDTGLAGGALPCATGVDPSSPNCKDIVGQYSLSAPGDAGSLFGLSTAPNGSSTLSFVAARDFAVTSTSSSTGPCFEVDFTTASIVSPSDCNVVAKKVVLSTYPTTKATLTTPHLEITQYDATVSTLKLGAPCLQLRTDPSHNNAVVLDSAGHWSCLNPTLSKNGPPMPECPEGVGWTKTNPCGYLYYSVVDIPGYDLHPNALSPTVRATACTSGSDCGQPIIIGGSMQQGIKYVETCTDAVHLTGCTTPVQITNGTTGGTLSQVRPWCAGKFPNFQYLPCVFKAQWLNKSTGNGNNDIQWQDYMTGDPGKRTTG